MSNNIFLTVNAENKQIAFLLGWHIAREHYVVARVSFMQGMMYPSCLLAEQSVEMFVKAILHLDHKSKDIHYLPALLQRGKTRIPYFDLLLSDRRLLSFIESLSLAYSKMRFGEVGFSINSKELCFALDEVVYSLDKLYQNDAHSHIVQRVRAVQKDGVTTQSYEHQKCPFFVPTTMKEAFLRDNKYFGEADISDDFMSSVPLP